jgi:hypothetical protein
MSGAACPSSVLRIAKPGPALGIVGTVRADRPRTSAPNSLLLPAVGATLTSIP